MATALWSCSAEDDGAQRLENYLMRLGRGLATAPPLLEASDPIIAPPRFVQAGIKRLPVAASSIGVLDFLSLSGCALQVNLGRRNSSLGRNASPSQRLLLDLEFLDLAPACIAYLANNDEAELAETLRKISEERRNELPKRIYNAVLAGPEFQQFWRIPPRLGNYPADVGGDVIDALGYIEEHIGQWLEGDYRADNKRLELNLARLMSGDGGALLKSVALQAQSLGRATTMVDRRADADPVCPNGVSTRAANITETVVSKYFAGDVQQWLARLSLRQHQIMPVTARIEDHLSAVLPWGYQRWRGQRQTLLEQLKSAPKRHVSAVKAALSQCPGLRWGSQPD